MPDSARRVRLEGIDLDTVFPTLRLLESFRMALQPTKLLLGMGLLVLVYFGGVALDFVWGTQTLAEDQALVLPGGLSEWYRDAYPEAQLQDTQAQYRVFEQFVAAELHAFAAMVDAATRLELGFGGLAGGQARGVLGALWNMVVVAPGWVWSHHPLFFLLFGAYALVVSTVLGGAIARLAAAQACADTHQGLFEVFDFTAPRAGWFVAAPLIPLAVVGVLWLILALVGWVVFHIPLVNVLGGAGFGPMLLLGFGATCLLVFTALGAGMMPAALAVEGSDAFDVVSRVCSFLIYRPLRFLLLTLAALVFGALLYLVVGLVVQLTLWFTVSAAGAWVGGFDRLVGVPGFGRMPAATEPAEPLSALERGTAWLLLVWSRLCFGVSLAFAVSFFFSAQTWIYLLLRREVEGTAFEDYHASVPEHGAGAAEKLEGVGAGADDPGGPEIESPGDGA